MTVARAVTEAAVPAMTVVHAAANPVRTAADWEAARAAVLADPGAYHAAAARRIPWFVAAIGTSGAWVRVNDGRWEGWDAVTGAAVALDLPPDFAPWTTAFDASDPPFFKWFAGGRTNGGMAEVDVHVLAGHGAEAALIFEGDRWDMAADDGRGAPVDCYSVSRKQLLLETAKCALALQGLGLKAGDRIALNMPSIPAQLYWTEAAKRLGIIYTPVFGGFSDKTLSDRIDDAGARVVVTADGGYRNAQVFPFKTAYTDPALDNYTPVAAAKRIVSERLASLDLAAGTVAAIDAAVAATLAGEVTVERSDVMRGVGRALAELSQSGLDAAAAARIRIAVAEALVATPPRVDHVIVVRHAHLPDIVWRSERDVWSHDLTDAAGAKLCAAAGVASEAELLALPDAEFVRAVWQPRAAAPRRRRIPAVRHLHQRLDGQAQGRRPRARRLHRRRRRDDARRLRRAPRRRHVRRRRPRLDHRAELYVLGRADLARHHRHVRGRAGLPARGALRRVDRAPRRDDLQGRRHLPQVRHVRRAEPRRHPPLRPVGPARRDLLRRADEPRRAGLRHGARHAAVHQQLLGNRAWRHRVDALLRQRRLPAEGGRAHLPAAVDRRRRLGRGRGRRSRRGHRLCARHRRRCAPPPCRTRREGRDRHRRALSLPRPHGVERHRLCRRERRGRRRLEGRRRALGGRLLDALGRHLGLYAGRLRRAPRGRQLLAPRPLGRRHQRLRPPHGDRGDRGRDPARQGPRPRFAGRQRPRRRRAAPREGADPARLRRPRTRPQALPGRPPPPDRPRPHREGRGRRAAGLHRGRRIPRDAERQIRPPHGPRAGRRRRSRRRLDAPQPRQPDRAQDRDRQLAAQAEAVGGAAAVRALPLLPHPVQYGRAGQEGGDGVRHQPAGQRAQRTRAR